MRLNRYNFLLVVGLVLTMGLSTAFGHKGDDDKKKEGDTGTLSVTTTALALPITIDGEDRGKTGIGKTPALFNLPVGPHTVEVTAPSGKKYTQNITIERGKRECICLKTVDTSISRPCPYRFHLEGPEKAIDGDPVTFKAIPELNSPVPLRYVWKIDNGQLTGGQGTQTINVDSTGIGGKTINAELDVNDDVYDGKCRQIISVPADVGRKPPPITGQECDKYTVKSMDDIKARLDNCFIQVQNVPDSLMYVIIHPGTDRNSTTRNTFDKLSKRVLDFLVKSKGLDPRRISIVKGSAVPTTSFEIWVVPPGAALPVVN